MNNVPPDRDRPDDADELYRRASERDPSRPSDAVRRAVLAHAERLAVQRARRPAGAADGALRRWLRQAWQRPAVFGTLAAAVVAGLVLVPLWSVLGSRFGSGAPAEPQPVTVTAINGLAEQVPLNEPPAPLAAPSANSAARESVAALRAVRPAPPSSTVAKVMPSRPPASPAEVVAEAERGRGALGNSRAALSAGAAHEERYGVSSEQPLQSTSADAVSAGAPAAMKAAAPEPAVAFRDAAQRGDVAALEALLERQRDIDARDAAGRTALMLAITHSQVNAVSALLAYGADPNAADAHGTTPLQAARSGDHPEIVATLRRYGAR